MYYVLTIVLILLVSVKGHLRFVDPVPRSTSTGVKTGPCGPETGQFTGHTITDLTPNSIYTIQLTESIYHANSPLRIALSRVNSDNYEDCILLDHIPQHTTGGTQNLFIPIQIPDVDCNPCALQVISIMADKIQQGICCEYNIDGTSGSCFSNYHSCANVRILGSTNRNALTCTQPTNWPYRNLPVRMYTQESSATLWTSTVINGQSGLLLNTSPGGGPVSNVCTGGSPVTPAPVSSNGGDTAGSFEVVVPLCIDSPAVGYNETNIGLVVQSVFGSAITGFTIARDPTWDFVSQVSGNPNIWSATITLYTDRPTVVQSLAQNNLCFQVSSAWGISTFSCSVCGVVTAASNQNNNNNGYSILSSSSSSFGAILLIISILFQNL